MQKIKLISLAATLIASTIIGLFVWDKIYLSPDKYLFLFEAVETKNYHPQTDTLRFVFYILISLVPFYILASYFCKNKFFTIKEIINIKFKSKLKIIDKLDSFHLLFYFIIFGIFFDFLKINFDDFFNGFDIYHEGLRLTPSINFIFTGEFWSSSFVERGLFGNFYPVILWTIFENNSIGLSRLSSLILLLTNKLLLVLLAKQITTYLNFEKFEKLFYFLLLSLIFLSFVDYYDTSHFSTRYPLYILFFNTFFISINNSNKINISNIFLGIFSILSILWWLDVGIFINFLIFLILLFYFLRKDFAKVNSILIGVFFGWIAFLIISPQNELSEFISNTLSIFSSIEIINQLPYPSPLFGENGRATKTLIYFTLAGVLAIFFCFTKENKTSNQLRIFYIFLYIASLISFKYGLVRSDSLHIQMSTGLLLVVLSSLILFYFFIFLNYFKFNIILSKIKNINFLIIILIIFFQFNLYQLNKIKEFPDKISNLIYAEDEAFLFDSISGYNNLIKYYKEITYNDNCIQIFTDEIALPYLLKKKSCTKFNTMIIASPEKSQNEFIKELDINKPEIILYNSEMFDIGYVKNLNLVNDYIKNNYIYHSKLDYWTFYKFDAHKTNKRLKN